MPIYLYIFNDLNFFKKKKIYNNFLTLHNNSNYIFQAYDGKKVSDGNTDKNNKVLDNEKYNEYICDISYSKSKVEMLIIEDGLCVYFNESNIGIIQSFYQLSSNNVKEIYNTLNNYQKGDPLIFLLE